MSADGQLRIDALERWIREHGGSVCGDAEVREEEGYRGVFAGKGLGADADVCRIPEELLITESLAEASLTFGPDLRAAAEELMPSAAGLLLLTAKLLQDEAPFAARSPLGATRSYFAPYYQALPPDLRHMPACWPSEHALHLAIRGSHLERLVKAKRHTLGLEFSLLQSQGADHISVSWDDFLWCRCVVASRAYSLSLGGHTQRCLVPWADLLNHSVGEQISARYAFQNAGTEADGGPAGHLLMRITKHVAEGQEIFQTYGDKSNPSLFVDYGFCLPQGRAVASVTLRPPSCGEKSAEVLREAIAKFWQLAGGRPGRREVGLEVEEVSWKRRPGWARNFVLLQILRALAACGEAGGDLGGAPDFAEPLSIGLESKALVKLRELSQQGLGRLSKPPVVPRDPGLEDWEVLAAQLCTQAVEEERALFHFFLSVAERGLGCLGTAGQEAEVQAASVMPAQEAAILEYLARLQLLKGPKQ